ncbi:MAG: hypothetical protein HKP25_14395 [Marinicaulis sp.]|nr:hypothetical protein [Marinicaulis sp.]
MARLVDLLQLRSGAGGSLAGRPSQETSLAVMLALLVSNNIGVFIVFFGSLWFMRECRRQKFGGDAASN